MGLVKTSHPPFLFTIEQYNGLIAASLSAALISLLASFTGLVVHFLLLWYDHHRPNNENYSPTTTAANFDTRTTTTTPSTNVVKDTSNDSNDATQHNHLDTTQTYGQGQYVKKRGSSTGAMNRVSLRLIVLACISYSVYSIVQIVVTGIRESALACRVLAYFIICFDVMGSMCLGLVGFNLVLVFVVNVKHPERFEKYYYGAIIASAIFVMVPPAVLKAGRTMDKSDSCWYHFFFEGRVANTFNWLYYYSWLLFASILATVTSIIAIRKLILEKKNFAHSKNMLNREETSYNRPGIYHMVSSPQLHSNTGFVTTSQQSQLSQNDLFRRVAIRCICYALVPVLCKSWGIGIEIAITSGIVVNYPLLIIDRFMSCIMGFFVSCIYFSDPSVRMVWHDMINDYKKRYVDQFYYVDVNKVIQVKRNYNPPHSTWTIINYSYSTTNKRVKSNSVPDHVYIYYSALRRPLEYHSFNHHNEQILSKKQKSRWVPMRRIDIPNYRSKNKDDTDKSRFIEPYSRPKLAKLIYWFFVHLLFYRPPYYYRQKNAFDEKGPSVDVSHTKKETLVSSSRPILNKESSYVSIQSNNKVSTQQSSSQFKEKSTNHQTTSSTDQLVNKRSSSYPLSITANVPTNQLSSKQRGKMKDTFLNQKIPHEKLPEYPTYRHIPTIGHLIQSVSPVHSFMSVRRVAAGPFIQVQQTRPSSLVSASSSPVTSLSLSSSSSSTTSSPLKQEISKSNTNIYNDNLDSKNDKALTVECVNHYHKAFLTSYHKDIMTYQPYTTFGQQSFHVDDGGLSPPSKQHYAFVYCQGRKSLTEKNVHTIQDIRDIDKEIVLSGVRTILLHIKDDMGTTIDKERDRIEFHVDNWKATSIINHN